MPTFQYTAKDVTGRELTGAMHADSEAAVVRTLDQRELFPVRIALQADARPRRGRGGRIKGRHLAACYGQLSDLLAAGVPMLRALDILSQTAVNAALGRAMADVRDGVSGGDALADAMAKRPQVFSSLHVAMVRAGEHAGFLEEVLTNLSAFLERQDDLRSKVHGAMIYPVLLASFAAIVVTIILLFLVPMFQEFLGDVPLPLPSQVLFAVSGTLRQHYVPLAAALLLLALLASSFLRSEGGRKLWTGAKLRLPLAGRAIRMVAITRFCRVLGTMLANGVQILQALTIAKDATGNELMSRAVEEAGENVRAGEPLAEPLRRSGFFPPEIIEMIAVAEESNQLDRVLVQLADTVERRTNRQVDAAVRLIEPLMLMIMASVIGFIAVGLLYPIFTMARTMR